MSLDDLIALVTANDGRIADLQKEVIRLTDVVRNQEKRISQLSHRLAAHMNGAPVVYRAKPHTQTNPPKPSLWTSDVQGAMEELPEVGREVDNDE